MIRRGSLDATIAAAIVVARRQPHRDRWSSPSCRSPAWSWPTSPGSSCRSWPGGRSIPPSSGPVFGVILAAFFGHLSVSLCGQEVLRREPSGKALVRGVVAAQATAIVVYCLWVLTVGGAVDGGVLAGEHGTALVPLADEVGPLVSILGSVYVVLGMGMGSDPLQPRPLQPDPGAAALPARRRSCSCPRRRRHPGALRAPAVEPPAAGPYRRHLPGPRPGAAVPPRRRPRRGAAPGRGHGRGPVGPAGRQRPVAPHQGRPRHRRAGPAAHPRHPRLVARQRPPAGGDRRWPSPSRATGTRWAPAWPTSSQSTRRRRRWSGGWPGRVSVDLRAGRGPRRR